tara:strand:+ start:2594 stop:4537 length:1944 start_codon:yes stop_codon:yes gene_type:complete
MIYDIEEELEKYELAKNDFSKVPAKDWQSTEVVTNEDGRTYTAGVVDGMLFELQPNEEEEVQKIDPAEFYKKDTNKDVNNQPPLIVDNEEEVALNSETNQELNTPVIQENAVLPNAEAPVIPNLIKDTTKAIVKGGAVGGRNTTSFISSILGSPGDLGNFLVNLTGTEDYKGIIPGSEAINKQFQAGLSWLDENLMPDIGVDEWANEPYNYETYGEIAEMVAQFATPGLPAAKIISGTKAVEKLWRRADLWVEGMKAPNPFVRGMVWGSIADAAAFPEKQLTLTGDLAEYFAGKTPEERTAFADLVVNVFQKNPEHAEIVNRLKGALEGFIIAGGLEGGVKLAVKTPPFLNIMVKAASKINWKELIDRVEIDPNTLSSGGFGGISLKKKDKFDDLTPLYHGSLTPDIKTFDKGTIGSANDQGFLGRGFYFASTPGEASYYGKNVNEYYKKGKIFDLNKKEGTSSAFMGGEQYIQWADKLEKIGMLDDINTKALEIHKKADKHIKNKGKYMPFQNSDGTDGWLYRIENFKDGPHYKDTYIKNYISHAGNTPTTKKEAFDNAYDRFISELRNESKLIDNNISPEFKGLNDSADYSFTDYIRQGGRGDNADKLTKALQKKGYKGATLGDETVIFEPEDIIRSDQFKKKSK